MELEIIRCVAAALAHPEIGVNAKLPGVPRDEGDEAPPAVTIADSTRDGWVARRAVVNGSAAAFPVLAVSVFRPAELQGEIATVLRDGKFDVQVEYVVRKARSEQALASALYTLRAAQRTLAEFHKPANIAMRTRNGVTLRVCERLHLVPVWAEMGEAVVTAQLIATYAVRDAAPYS